MRAAVEMLRALAELNASRAAESKRAIRIGIGINTGLLTLGTIGGGTRIKCGVIGDSVNLAARVEGPPRRTACRCSSRSTRASGCATRTTSAPSTACSSWGSRSR